MFPDATASQRMFAFALVAAAAAFIVVPSGASPASRAPRHIPNTIRSIPARSSNAHDPGITEENGAFIVYRVRAAHAAARVRPRPRTSSAPAAHSALPSPASSPSLAPAASPAPTPSPSFTPAPSPSQTPVQAYGDPQQYALGQVGAAQFACLLPLWMRESGWNPAAENPGSGAYGIPQALPGDKMAEFGSDWQTNPITQIKWGISYIDSTYGSPCAAWAHEEATGWY